MAELTLKFCPHCGAELQASDVTCPQCGTDLRPFRQAEAPQEPAKPRLNLNALSANPYREGMKRLKQRTGDEEPQPKHRWHWPWSKE